MIGSTLGCGIDTGTNTVRILIAEVADGRIVKEIYSGREITRLGAGLTRTGKLSSEGAAKTLELFRHFKKITDRYNVKHILAAATSAVREASDSEKFISEAISVGIPLVTISGEEEANYIYKGVISNTPDLRENTLIYDIGGGSTEIICVRRGDLRFVKSIPVGVVKLADRFNFKRALQPETLDKCSAYINSLLKPVFDELHYILGGNYPSVYIGTAGTVTTIAAVDMEMDIYDPDIINNHILTNNRLSLINKKLSRLTADERLAVKGLERGREDILIPGILIVEEILRIAGCDRSSVSDNGLREGLTIASVD
ncbi:MAG: hypothetical protein LBH05_06490 [Deferribacteraceae bacterium]|jgi:exopolyphosphatase/guanosine-5'-triphosphate,3'-diphosphate pyrophosphatase|nr:hypothetical protein [Deferribacteraceae bacterium]